MLDECRQRWESDSTTQTSHLWYPKKVGKVTDSGVSRLPPVSLNRLGAPCACVRPCVP